MTAVFRFSKVVLSIQLMFKWKFRTLETGLREATIDPRVINKYVNMKRYQQIKIKTPGFAAGNEDARFESLRSGATGHSEQNREG